MFRVMVKSVSGNTVHSEHDRFRDAADQADMVRGYVAGEQKAYEYAKRNQSFVGSFAEWMGQDEEERAEYELGAAGIPTE